MRHWKSASVRPEGISAIFGLPLPRAHDDSASHSFADESLPIAATASLAEDAPEHFLEAGTTAAGSTRMSRIDFAETLADLVNQVDIAGAKLIEEIATLAEAVILRALGQMDDKQALAGAIETALRESAIAAPTVIELNPDDAATVMEALARIRPGGTQPPDVKTDPSLPPGEVVLVSTLGRIHAGARSRLSTIIRGMKDENR